VKIVYQYYAGTRSLYIQEGRQDKGRKTAPRAGARGLSHVRTPPHLRTPPYSDMAHRSCSVITKRAYGSPSAHVNSSVGCCSNSIVTECAHSSAHTFGAPKTYLQAAISREPQPHSGSPQSSPGQSVRRVAESFFLLWAFLSLASPGSHLPCILLVCGKSIVALNCLTSRTASDCRSHRSPVVCRAEFLLRVLDV